MNRITTWAMPLLTAGLLAGCGAAGTPSPKASPVVASPASPTLVALTPSPTPRPRPAPTATETPAPRTEVVLTLPDSSWTFWDPFEREAQLLRVVSQPGIHTAGAPDQNHVLLVYDPSQLTQEEAIQVFERATGLKVVGTDC